MDRSWMIEQLKHYLPLLDEAAKIRNPFKAEQKKLTDAARSFWQSKHYAQAVEESWKSINAHLQDKAGRRDVSDDQLASEVLSDTPPKADKTKLRLPGDRSTPTWKRRQRGLHQLALGCAAGVRNVVAHTPDLELPQQVALEYLATLSVLARWIDECEVEAAP